MITFVPRQAHLPKDKSGLVCHTVKFFKEELWMRQILPAKRSSNHQLVYSFGPGTHIQPLDEMPPSPTHKKVKLHILKTNASRKEHTKMTFYQINNKTKNLTQRVIW